MSNAYLASPDLFQDRIVFKTDDDLFIHDLSTRATSRITTAKADVLYPRFSSDGGRVFYLSNDTGQFDLYEYTTATSQTRRLTFIGVDRILFTSKDSVLFASSYQTHDRSMLLGYSVNLKTLDISPKNLGPMYAYSENSFGSVIGLNTSDIARWKRYRGGTAGRILVKQKKDKEYKEILQRLKGNLSRPALADNKLFFLSDHEGLGKIYSCNLNGKAVKVECEQKDFYIRNFSIYGNCLVYQSAGDLFLYDIVTKNEVRVDISSCSNFLQERPRFLNPENNIDDAEVTEEKEILCVTRGILNILPAWERGNLQWDKPSRVKFAKDLNKSHAVYCSVNELGLDEIYRVSKKSLQTTQLFSTKEFGKILHIEVSTCSQFLAIGNNRCELFLADLKSRKIIRIDKSSFGEIHEFDFSPDSSYLAYRFMPKNARSELKVFNLKSKKKRVLIESISQDENPRFSRCGRYLFFRSIREFRANYEETHFSLGFPKAWGVYAIKLDAAAIHPLERFEQSDEEKFDYKKVETKIDFENIDQRIYPISDGLGGYHDLKIAKDSLFVLKDASEEVIPSSGEKGDELYWYNFKEDKFEIFDRNIIDFKLGPKKGQLLLTLEDGLRLVSTNSKPTDGDDVGRKDGHIDLERIVLKVDPQKEWKQIFIESWALQKEHFWKKDMNGVNWNNIRKKYTPLLSKIHTRSELSDLIWEVQGELDTSHCYEFGGDYYRKPNSNKVAELGASLTFNPKSKSYSVDSLFKGDSWLDETSPLFEYGIEKGDEIFGAMGKTFRHSQDIYKILEGHCSNDLTLEIRKKGKKKKETVVITFSSGPKKMYYRNWVNGNRELIHKKSKGKIGYIHIPDMGSDGFSEFYRQYLAEKDYQGLIIDVRFNGGGHISQLILKELIQKRIAIDETRYFSEDRYPMTAPNGKLLCLTNEFCGSDGDIFCQAFKSLKLGKLVGKRTWGGVIGMWVRYSLIDGSATSQPEFCFKFDDIGYKVENYGVDPNIVVDNTPGHYSKGIDEQLEIALKTITKDI